MSHVIGDEKAVARGLVGDRVAGHHDLAACRRRAQRSCRAHRRRAQPRPERGHRFIGGLESLLRLSASANSEKRHSGSANACGATDEGTDRIGHDIISLVDVLAVIVGKARHAAAAAAAAAATRASAAIRGAATAAPAATNMRASTATAERAEACWPRLDWDRASPPLSTLSKRAVMSAAGAPAAARTGTIAPRRCLARSAAWYRAAAAWRRRRGDRRGRPSGSRHAAAARASGRSPRRDGRQRRPSGFSTCCPSRPRKSMRLSRLPASAPWRISAARRCCCSARRADDRDCATSSSRC